MYDSMWLERFGDIDELVFYVFCAVSGLILIISVVNLILGCAFCKSSVSISSDFHIELGCLLIAYTVLSRGVHLEWGSPWSYSAMCEIYHVILLIGLTQFMGGLFVKAWTIFLFYRYNRDKKPIREEWIPNLLIWLLLLIIAAVALAWIFIPEFTPKYQPLKNHTCNYENGEEWMIATSAWHALLLFLAFIAIFFNCATTRRTPGFLESNVLAAIIVNTVLVVVAALCIYYLYFPEMSPSRTQQYAIMGGLELYMCLFADVLLLLSKVCGVCRNSSSGKGMDYGDNYDTIESNRNSMTQPNPSYDSDLVNGKGDNDTFQY